MKPPSSTIKPPPQGFHGWFTVYYNMIAPHELMEIQAWFQSIDTDRSGHITANEIQRCTFANVPLGFDTAKKLVQVFDKDRGGSIDFYEYAAMHKFLSLMQHAFFAGDSDRSGRLDAREIHTALGVGRMTVGFPSVNSLYTKYNRDGYGVSFSDFLQLVAHIACAKSTFEWEQAVQGNKGVITINFDKFVELSSKV